MTESKSWLGMYVSYILKHPEHSILWTFVFVNLIFQQFPGTEGNPLRRGRFEDPAVLRTDASHRCC